MLDKLSATYNEAGVCLQLVKIPPIRSEYVRLVFVFVATRTRRPHTDGFLPLSVAHCWGHNNKAPVNPVEMFSNVFFYAARKLWLPTLLRFSWLLLNSDCQQPQALLIQLFKYKLIFTRLVVIISGGRQGWEGWRKSGSVMDGRR